MKMTGGPATRNLKIILLVAALIIAAGTLYYTRGLVEKLQKREKQIAELYAKGMEYIANPEDNSTNLTFIFENMIKPIDFPLILTGSDDSFDLKLKNSFRNFAIDSTLSLKEQTAYVKKEIAEMDAINPPITIAYNDTIVLGRIHYGNSELIKQLRNYPYYQIAFAAAFILIGYVIFSYIKKNEQSSIWVGMSKETAHQLGTPLSSLMGWSEILKLSHKDPDRVLDISEEINNDLARLNKITQRFSKIGSQPELKDANVYEEIEKTIKYFERRLPQIGKNVVLKLEGDENLCTKLNPELFSWVLENLIKNALDAIEGKKGSISFYVTNHHKNIEIEVKDTGKGIDMRRKKDIFRPGYSTKRRGWGLGLSLTKRIIETYHKGKIFVKSSSPEGTTFKIILHK
ncbi:MAG: HAMP domain-containing sensor histidine kinase [Bacteroidota bacterium]|nr:HAMP domain-containing sensor histidine kinase [Bacteroidota bacterium]MDP4191115.1 HAMP domain-containing sensor histidine kinase [Bacteroidota bacterium]MDP4193479.1 HAMP domain-containing sensor histidine kinase [Bacteroidota bacterium]